MGLEFHLEVHSVSEIRMGCGSSQPVAAEQNANVRNGDVKREGDSTRSPKLKKRGSASSKSSSSSSSRSSSARSKKSRPETAPGGNTPVQVQPENDVQPQAQQLEEVQNTEAPASNNNKVTYSLNKDSEEPAAAEEVTKVEETPDETTTQSAVVAAEENSKPAEDQEHGKPNFSEDVLKEFVEVENQVKSLEEKGAENGHQIKHGRLVELHKKLGECNGEVQKLKAQTDKEFQDVIDMSAGFNVRSLFVSQDQLNAEFAKEKQEYVDALNKQEIAEARI
ncbi:hypothetical protein OS493_003411 [Desmophyllum pertusum]|uniref:Uncharacterized protein n=1 Tax=Desmophyllum pertusum TaxID=174260 RepID=A0A9X0A5I3_9CNID|nr:hypothetical protein OS493_003411 [Desmophyllum pertusum]